MAGNLKRPESIIAVISVALLATLVLLRSATASAVSLPSTYDTGPRGYAAVYELLAREHVDVRRFEEPISSIFSYHGTLVLAGGKDVAPLYGTQSAAVIAWVRSGGTAVIVGTVGPVMQAKLGLPAVLPIHARAAMTACGFRGHLVLSAPFGLGVRRECRHDRQTLAQAGNSGVAGAYRLGKGLLIYATTAQIFDNAHLARADNAAFAYALLRGSHVFFDEYTFGYSRAKTFWQVLPLPLRAAVGLAVFLLAVAITGAALSGVPARVERRSSQRSGVEYIGSLARMLQRGGARRATVQRLCSAVEQRLSGRAAGDARLRGLVEQARALQALAAPTDADLIAAGRLFASVPKDIAW